MWENIRTNMETYGLSICKWGFLKIGEPQVTMVVSMRIAWMTQGYPHDLENLHL